MNAFSGPLLRALQAEGFDIVRSADSMPSAIDAEVLELAWRQGRIVITEDADFAELTVRLGYQSYGVVHVNLQSMTKIDRERRIVQALKALGDSVMGAYVTVEPSRTRLRPLKATP